MYVFDSRRMVTVDFLRDLKRSLQQPGIEVLELRTHVSVSIASQSASGPPENWDATPYLLSFHFRVNVLRGILFLRLLRVAPCAGGAKGLRLAPRERRAPTACLAAFARGTVACYHARDAGDWWSNG